MSTTVHPTARVEVGARLGEGVVIGPYAAVEGGATLGPGVVLGAFSTVGTRSQLGAGVRLAERATVGSDVILGSGSALGVGAIVLGPARLGRNCRVFPGAVIGESPQDRSWSGEATELVVGDHVILREQVTVHRGTVKGGGVTRIGSHGLFMVGVHVAHDCQIGDHAQLANLTTLGGHVVLEDHVVTGGQVAIAPFVRIGRGTFLAGGAMVERSLPPFVIASGDRARVRAPNRVGLERCQIPSGSREAVMTAFKCVFSAGRLRSDGIAEGRARFGHDPYVTELLDALSSTGQR